MKFAYRILSVFLLTVAVLSAVGCKNASSETDTNAETEAKPETKTETESGSVESDTAKTTGSETASETSPDESETKHPNAYHASGTFRSMTNTHLNLFVDWTAESADGVHVTLTLTATLHCYSIDVGARPGMGKITVGGKTYGFSTPAYRQDENKKTTFEVFSKTYRLTAGEDFSVSPDGTTSLPVTVVWPFNGVYGKVPLGDVSAGATLTFGSQSR